MKKTLIYIFVCLIINNILVAGNVSNSKKDDISLFASDMVDSLRLHPEITFQRIPTIIVDSSSLEYLNEIDHPEINEYLYINGLNVKEFENDFRIQYIFNNDLLPPFYKENNPEDSIPVFSYSGFISCRADTAKLYIDSLSGIEIDIVPQMHNNLLRINLYINRV